MTYIVIIGALKSRNMKKNSSESKKARETLGEGLPVDDISKCGDGKEAAKQSAINRETQETERKHEQQTVKTEIDFLAARERVKKIKEQFLKIQAAESRIKLQGITVPISHLGQNLHRYHVKPGSRIVRKLIQAGFLLHLLKRGLVTLPDHMPDFYAGMDGSVVTVEYIADNPDKFFIKDSVELIMDLYQNGYTNLLFRENILKHETWSFKGQTLNIHQISDVLLNDTSEDLSCHSNVIFALFEAGYESKLEQAGYIEKQQSADSEDETASDSTQVSSVKEKVKLYIYFCCL